jgi:hypothetical protein
MLTAKIACFVARSSGNNASGVYTEFAGAVTDVRLAAYDRWHRYQEDPDSPAFAAARDEYWKLYGVPRNVQLKLRVTG